MELPSVLVIGASWVTITGGVWALFERAETVVSPEIKAEITLWLRNLPAATMSASWPATFARVFDRIFGSRHLSWQCFLRSAVASLISIVIVTLIWAAVRPSEMKSFIAAESIVFVLGAPILSGLVVNVVPDYASLLETRFVIGRMKNCDSRAVIAWLLFDTIASAAIFMLPYAAFIVIISYLADDTSIADSVVRILRDVPEYILPLHAKTDSLPDGVFFYSTFFTSVWVWLYAVAGFALRLTQAVGVGASHLTAVLDVEQKPLRSLGFVSNLLVTLAYVLAWPFLKP